MLDDAESCVRYGAAARITKTPSISAGKGDQGGAAGQITVWPSEKNLPKDGGPRKCLCDGELSMGQIIEDVELAIPLLATRPALQKNGRLLAHSEVFF
jgi:hypothetical protein